MTLVRRSSKLLAVFCFPCDVIGYNSTVMPLLPIFDEQLMDDFITTRCFLWFVFYQCCFQFRHCQCLCEAAVVVGWMTTFFALQVSHHSGIYMIVLDCNLLVIGKCLLTYFPSFCGLSLMHHQFQIKNIVNVFVLVFLHLSCTEVTMLCWLR